jgi:uncharacterized protein
MKDNFYENLKQKLEEQTKFPSVYMFKFIIPSDNKKLAQVESLFGKEAQITTRQSSSNKFISVTAKELMINADEIIAVYKNAEKIEGIMSL